MHNNHFDKNWQKHLNLPTHFQFLCLIYLYATMTSCLLINAVKVQASFHWHFMTTELWYKRQKFHSMLGSWERVQESHKRKETAPQSGCTAMDTYVLLYLYMGINDALGGHDPLYDLFLVWGLVKEVRNKSHQHSYRLDWKCVSFPVSQDYEYANHPQSTQHQKNDRCPPPPQMLPERACEVPGCRSDSECERHKRCCYNGCIYACLESVQPPPGQQHTDGHAHRSV